MRTYCNSSYEGMKKPAENGRMKKVALAMAAVAAVAVIALAVLLLLPEREKPAGPVSQAPDNSGRYEDAKAKAAEGMRMARKYIYDVKTGAAVEEEFVRAGRLLADAVRILSELVREFPSCREAEELLKETVAVRNDLEKFHSSLVML